MKGGSTPETAWADLYPAWSKEFQRAQQTLDPEARKKIWFDLQAELWEKGGYVVWGYSDIVDALSPKVRGIEPWGNISLGGFLWQKAWLED